MRPEIAIIGYGTVGKAMALSFPSAVLYDIKPGMPDDKVAVNKCNLAFVCVATPRNEDGSCDISAVEEIVSWLKTPLIVIRSTIPPGTTKKLIEKFKKNILFSPEFIGETPYHPYKDAEKIGFVVLGGEKEQAIQVAQLYSRLYGPTLKFIFTDSSTAELAKYMENCFFATKLMFCYEFFKIAQAIGVSYEELREIWLVDSRISRDHTMIFRDDLGFSGKCIPKDLSAIIKFAETVSCEVSLLKKVSEINQNIRQSLTK